MHTFPSWLPPGAHHTGIWIKGIVDARQENPQRTVAFMNKLYLPKLACCLWTLIYFLWFFLIVRFWLVLTDVKKPSRIADKSKDNGRGQKKKRKKKGRKGEELCLLYNGKTLKYVNSNLPCPLQCYVTSLCNWEISRAICWYVFCF